MEVLLTVPGPASMALDFEPLGFSQREGNKMEAGEARRGTCSLIAAHSNRNMELFAQGPLIINKA